MSETASAVAVSGIGRRQPAAFAGPPPAWKSISRVQDRHRQLTGHPVLEPERCARVLLLREPARAMRAGISGSVAGVDGGSVNGAPLTCPAMRSVTRRPRRLPVAP